VVVVAVLEALVRQHLVTEVLAVQASSSSNTYNPQPMLFLTSTPLQFGNAQQVLTQLTTW
jgi:hypothetical protein